MYKNKYKQNTEQKYIKRQANWQEKMIFYSKQQMKLKPNIHSKE